MAETKFINRKSFTATNTVRSAATITVLVFCLSAAHGENLTTLDGRTFTNVISVTNYSSVVVITHDGGASGVKASNLPEDFRAKYGIKIPTNTVTRQNNSQTTNTVDLFLIQNSDSELTVEKDIGEHFFDQDNHVTNSEPSGCAIRVSTKGFELAAYKFGLEQTKPLRSEQIKFQFGQEDSLEKTLGKFVEWSEIASQNNSESFQKDIAQLPTLDALGHPITSNLTFGWDKGSLKEDRATLYVSGAPGGWFYEAEVIHFREFLGLLPSLKEELKEKIQKQEAEKVLFK